MDAIDGTGIGRAWPLLTGERAHYELAAEHEDEAYRLLRVMGAFANDGGLLPEQVWDTRDISERGLTFGHPLVRPCRWSGLTLNTSSCAVPCRKSGCLIYRPIRNNVI